MLTINTYLGWSRLPESSQITMGLFALLVAYVGGLQLLRFRRSVETVPILILTGRLYHLN